MRNSVPLASLVALLGAASASAQPPVSAGTRISGVVFDSLAHQPLAGASVQILRTDSTTALSGQYTRFATADDLGRYQLDSVPAGNYTLGFFHPSIDSLGIDLPLVSLRVNGATAARADLAVPSHGRLIVQLCGAPAATDSSSVITGFVRDAVTGRAAEGAQVLLEWGEIVIRGNSLTTEVQRLVTGTRRDGWYALCNVPVAWMMQLRVARGADTSGAIQARLVGRKVVPHDLSVGPVRRIVRSAPGQGAGNVMADEQVIWSGEARLIGTVLGADGRPVPGAQVHLTGNDAIATTGASGSFLLTGLPAGSQTLEARAIGFVPERITVQLIPDSSVRVAALALTRIRAVLDTVRVTASRVYSSDPNGFEARMRAGSGHFIDRAKIDKQNPSNPSDLMRLIPRVDVASAGVGFFGRYIVMKNSFGLGYCRPSIYIDHAFYKPGEVELDDLVSLDRIEGVEIYVHQSQAPPQFQNTMSGCGSIVVWTRNTARNRKE